MQDAELDLISLEGLARQGYCREDCCRSKYCTGTTGKGLAGLDATMTCVLIGSRGVFS